VRRALHGLARDLDLPVGSNPHDPALDGCAHHVREIDGFRLRAIAVLLGLMGEPGEPVAGPFSAFVSRGPCALYA
jgi:hypothetical protein